MKDNFSKQAKLYARYRPVYPQSLFDFIISHVENKDTAWDCATGNGQTAMAVSKYFNKVLATDISRQQLENAAKGPNIFYSLQSAEQTSFEPETIDLVTVSQALHWFDFGRFYAEVKRVTRPGAKIAVWMYSLLRISPGIDKLIDNYHFGTLENYWDRERKYVDDKYSSIPFPFEQVKTPSFEIRFEWSLADLEGYLNTWSALQKFIASNGYNPVDELIKQIGSVWKADKMKIIFPLQLLLGKANN